jgi:PAS domain S-box-containing protein
VTHNTRLRRHSLTPASAAAHRAPSTIAAPEAEATAATAEYPKTESPKTDPVKTEYPKDDHPIHEFPKTDDSDAFAVFDAMSDIVCVTTPDGTLRFLNRAGRDLLGYVGDDAFLIGSLFPTHTPAARALLLDEVLPAAIRAGSVICDTALQTADGRVFPASQTVVVTRRGDGAPQSLTIVIRNVSIERQTAARLGESQRLFEMITRNSPDLLFLYDPQDERIVWMNRCPHAFLGGAEHDARTMTSREIIRLVHDDDRAQFRATGALMAAAYGDSDVLAADLRVRTNGGNWRWVHTRASVFSRRETGAPLLLLGVATDISARKKLERNLLRARDSAEHGTRIKNDFLARVSDQFRGALNEMIGTASEVHANREHRLTAREREQLHDMISNATRLLASVSDLRDYTRIEAGEMPVHQTRVDARAVIRESAAAFADHPARDRTPITLQLPDVVAPLLIDPDRLRQALSHLIASALAVSTNGVAITLRVDGPQSHPVAIDVSDTGEGIEESLQALAFEPFGASLHSTSSTMSATCSTGLGLPLARALCEMVGCSLTLAPASALGGTTFRVTLPVMSRAAELAAQFLVPTTESAGNADQGRKVLPSV